MSDMIPHHKGKPLTAEDAKVPCPSCDKRHVCDWDAEFPECTESIVKADKSIILTLWRCKCGAVVGVTIDDDFGSTPYIPDRYNY